MILHIVRLKDICNFFQAANTIADTELILVNVNDAPVRFLFFCPDLSQPQEVCVVGENAGVFSNRIVQLSFIGQAEIAHVKRREGVNSAPLEACGNADVDTLVRINSNRHWPASV